MALEPGSPGPQSVEARPSAWGGLSAILDTPQKRGITIVVILAAMVIAPQAFGTYATVILTNALLYTILAMPACSTSVMPHSLRSAPIRSVSSPRGSAGTSGPPSRWRLSSQ